MLAVAAFGSIGWVLAVSWHRDQFALDFHHELYVQARGLLETGVAFDPPDVVIDGSNRIFPPLATYLATPLALMPPTAADVVMTFLLLATAAGTLLVLGVRDWRVYAIVAIWPPFLSGVQTANVTFFVSLLAALAWRYRARRLLPGVLIGLAIAVKLFPWPLTIWLLVTRRFVSAAASAAIGAGSILLVAPFGSPLDYLRLVRRLGEEMAANGYTVYAMLGADTAGRAVWGLVALLSLGLVVACRGSDRRCFTVAVLACLLCTPIVWLHYFQLLAVPIAIVRPRLSALWLAPLATWLVPVGYAERWEVAFTLALVGAAVFATVRVDAGSAHAETRAEVGLPPMQGSFRSSG